MASGWKSCQLRCAYFLLKRFWPMYEDVHIDEIKQLQYSDSCLYQNVIILFSDQNDAENAWMQQPRIEHDISILTAFTTVFDDGPISCVFYILGRFGGRIHIELYHVALATQGSPGGLDNSYVQIWRSITFYYQLCPWRRSWVASYWEIRRFIS